MVRDRPITFVVLGFWFLFWLLNGLDKFMPGRSLGFVRWWGNNRLEKFGMYFDRLAVDVSAVWPTLVFAGIVELAAASVFAVAAWKLFKGQPGSVRLADQAIALSIAIFAGFAIFDVVVGDRAELLEHSTYIGVLLISFLAMAAEVYFHHLRIESGISKPLPNTLTPAASPPVAGE